jgi:tetratricopeptide (TPR) repeat protein
MYPAEPAEPEPPVQAPLMPSPPEEDDPLDAWASSAVTSDGYDDDLFGDDAEQGSSKAPLIALALLLVAVGAVTAFLMRDTVEPFKLPDKALNTGWHATALKARKAPTSVAAIDGDWTLPPRAGGPAALPSNAAVASAASVAPDSAAPESTPAANPTSQGGGAVKPVADVAPKSAQPATTPAKADPIPAPPVDNGAFAKLMKDSQAQVAKGRYSQAAGMLAKAVKLQPKNADAHLAHANALLEAGKDDAALNSAQKAIRYRPSAAKAHLIIGTVYQMKGQKAAAIDAYDKFLKLAPNGGNSAEVRKILEGLR